MAEVSREAGTHRILALCVGLEGESPLRLIEYCGRFSRKNWYKMTGGSTEQFVRMLRDRGHESVIEHSWMMVEFYNVSRGFTHELVRHRLASYTQESTRYVDESDFRVVIPPDKDPDEKLVDIVLPDGHFYSVSFNEWVELNEQMYRGLRDAGWVPEDARQVLPIGIEARIVMSANFREWRHVFELRCSPRAHWEIRRIMVNLLRDVQERIPIVFDDFKIEKEHNGKATAYRIPAREPEKG